MYNKNEMHRIFELMLSFELKNESVKIIIYKSIVYLIECVVGYYAM